MKTMATRFADCDFCGHRKPRCRPASRGLMIQEKCSPLLTISQHQTQAKWALMVVHAECCAQVTIAVGDWTEFGFGTNAPGQARPGRQTGMEGAVAV